MSSAATQPPRGRGRQRKGKLRGEGSRVDPGGRNPAGAAPQSGQGGDETRRSDSKGKRKAREQTSTTGGSVDTLAVSSNAPIVRLSSSLGAMSLRDATRPLRPGYGTAGKQITVCTNFLQVKLPDGEYYDYKVSAQPNPKGAADVEEVFRLFDEAIQKEEWSAGVVHDRSSRLVSRTELPVPLPSFAIQLQREGMAEHYICSITFFRTLDITEFKRYLQGQLTDYNPSPIISALNLDTQRAASKHGIRIGKRAKPKDEGTDQSSDGKARHFWRDLKGNPIPLRDGLELLRGIFTSARPSVEGLLLNVNACTMAFYQPGNMAAKFTETRSKAGGIPRLPDALANSNSLRVTTTYLGYRKRKAVFRIADKNAKQHAFHCAELGGQVTVEKYFQLKYKITLEYPDLPLIDIGNQSRSNFIPPELCEVEPGMPYSGRLTGMQARDMLRAACKLPKDNKDFIMKTGLPKFALNQPTRLGLKVTLEMMEIPARELGSPKVTYGNKSPVPIKDAGWNLIGKKFDVGARVQNWWALVLEGTHQFNFSGTRDTQLLGLLENFSKSLSASGMQISRDAVMPSEIIFLRSFGKANAAKEIRNEFLKHPNIPNFVLVLLPRHHEIYSTIKRIGDVELGIHTVHILMDKVLENKRVEQYYGNVALKINSKLGGINHRLAQPAMKWLTEEKTMMVGIDVSHPTGESGVEGAPSVAAVVASVDDSFFQFPASLRIQRGKQEMLHELRQMFMERLQLYQSRNDCLPKRIYVFRDGVSEGQYDIVLGEELIQMREAIETMYTDASQVPKITILVCGKRHHARFYPKDSSHTTKNGNTQPGTIVDRSITSAYDFDFYLQPHAGLQGTVRPTHYVVIYDENNLSADAIQQGTHSASYLYARATKAVGLVPPAYYADIACERGRCYIQEFFAATKKGKDKDKDALEKVFRDAQAKWGNGVHQNIRDSMFYI